MPTVSELVNGGFPGYAGWDDASANADFNATGGAGKSGSSSGGSNSSTFSFDQAAAEKKAMDELTPYYTKLLQIYDGNIELAKKRITEDYNRGLRYSQDITNNALGDTAAAKAENDRKFKIALGDLDQEANTRGIFNSGIKATNVQNANADELFKQTQLDNQARDLTLAQKQKEEELAVTQTRDLQDKASQAIPDIAGYVTPKDAYKTTLANQYSTDVGTKVSNAFNKAVTYNNVTNTPLANVAPTNYTDLLNEALKKSGLTATA